ncbi:MAG: DUF4175 family protein [Robiginitomaculum sp.]|nr:DUF4175 family protein [Robiginitomaculum sp.]
MAYNGNMSQTPTTSVLTKRAESLTRRAFRHLLWETYAPVLALAALFILLFVVAAASGFWQFIGDPWRLIGLVFAVFFVVKAALAARRTLVPTRSQARRRVEHDSGLSHRPLDTVVDTPALETLDDLDDPAKNQAWQNHLKKSQEQIQRAGTSSLRPALAPIDKYYLRLALPVMLLLAFMVGAGDNYERLRASLTPGWVSGASGKSAHYEAWIDPPAYTARPPSYFKGQKSLPTPEGSEFVARISGVKTAPRLIIRQKNGHTIRISPKRLGPQSFEARAIIEHDSTASFRLGKSEQVWGLDVAIDQMPIVTFDEAPDAGKRDRLEFKYSLEDDYGVESLLLSMALQSDPDVSEQISIALPGSSVRSAKQEPGGLDLTKHKWAGKKVTGRLLAVDGKRQVGSTALHDFIVPDKIFVEPLAKAVAEQRLLMLAGTDEYAPMKSAKPVVEKHQPIFAVDRPDLAIDRAPEPVRRTALLIDAITNKPAGVFEDPSVYMGLRHIYRRLQTAREQDELGGIPEDLWTIALRAEFGLLGDALEDMKRAERALNNAMARRAPQREVDALFERYNEAVDRYMEQLMLDAVKNAKSSADGGDSGGGGDNFQMDEIQALLDAIEEANRMGDTAAARKALTKLAQLLENMQIQLAEGGGGSGSGVGEGMSEELKEALEELNDILGEQRRLRDETQDAGRAEADQGSGQDEASNGQSGGEQSQDGPSGRDLAEQQGEIGELLRSLEDGTEQPGGGKEGDKNGAGSDGDIKDALNDARDAMGRSQRALEDGEYYGAGRAQSDAIDALRQAGEGLLAQEAQRLLDADETGGNREAGGNGDPFGRGDGGDGIGESDIDVPEKSDQQRARELLEELRRRSGEQEREKIERDYLERLLERF